MASPKGLAILFSIVLLDFGWRSGNELFLVLADDQSGTATV
jgi:hypothetical protein